MSYTPPLGNAVHFVLSGTPYTPPLGNAVHFVLGAAAGPGATLVASGIASLAGQISVVNPLVFDSAVGYVKWYASVVIGAVDVSSRLAGQISISGSEDAARLASLSVIPLSPAEFSGYEGQPVTIDLTLFRPAVSATYRRFTGVVETVDLAAADRVVTISCRDGYQERPKACTSAADVEALFAGLVSPSVLIEWSADQPQPAAYFSALLETMPGCCAIDGNGLWQAVPWSIGAPLASFGAGDVLNGSLRLTRANRVDLPSAIVAQLNFRYARLHAAEKVLTWAAVTNERYVVDGVPTLPKSTVQAALDGISGWTIKGKPTITQPIVGTHMVIVGGDSVPYVVTYEQAQATCAALSATLYRRWYQQTQTTYTVTIEMGGSSARDDSISETLTSEFDHGAWESAASSETGSGIYQANAPTVATPPTGYEGLPDPWPPANSGIVHAPDVDAAKLNAAVRTVVAKAVRRAAAGKRKQTVMFERPLDPRWEIGAVLAVSAYGVSATGQLVDFSDTLDHDSGDAVSRLTLACPSGSGAETGFTATVAFPTADVAHALLMTPLGNHTGASTLTVPNPPEDTLCGFLFNVIPTGNTYDSAAPVYEPQFRIVMPEIPAAARDPLELSAAITAAITIAGSGVEVTF